jgi:hypothetical protein
MTDTYTINTVDDPVVYASLVEITPIVTAH